VRRVPEKKEERKRTERRSRSTRLARRRIGIRGTTRWDRDGELHGDTGAIGWHVY